ncbi:ferritin 1 heavy chain [Halictus rubicundus]|uniref:ferritin 1 heavy chain n=1 Tax=Halictus rubicundus TaxID=77578 RepID=UPI0040360DBE
MKPIYVVFVTFFFIVGSLGEKLQCKNPSDEPKELSDMEKVCTGKLQSQIKTEINAALTYLSMGVHFAKDTNHRPGFSKFFFDAANEEREHAIKIIEYLLMRGEVMDGDSQIVNTKENIISSWSTGFDALQKALELEKNVTNSIHDIIKTCEEVKDYHLADYLTTDFLDEQYKGQRDLAGKISILSGMNGLGAPLGEFLFDKKLLNGEI